MMSNTIFKPETKIKKDFISITKFENNVLRLICKEKTLQAISDILGVSTHTVHAYQLSLFQKFQAKNRQHLMKILQLQK